jgi:hypothetical protein
MRNLIITVALLCACGPSGRDLAIAKTARYQGDKLVLFNAVKSTTEGKYKLAQSDENTLTVQTAGRWFTPEGLVATSGEQDIRSIPDKSINVVLIVKLVQDGDNWVVDVGANMMRYNRGMPNPEKVSLKDPSLPGWASGKVDQLAFDIHDALKQYEIKAGGPAMAPPAGSAAPAGEGAPPPPPAAETPPPAS